MRAASSRAHPGVTDAADGGGVDSTLLAPTSVPPSWPPPLQVLLGEPAPETWSAVLRPLAGRLRSLSATTVTLRPPDDTDATRGDTTPDDTTPDT
jgi:hypothetical protein